MLVGAAPAVHSFCDLDITYTIHYDTSVPTVAPLADWVPKQHNVTFVCTA